MFVVPRLCLESEAMVPPDFWLIAHLWVARSCPVYCVWQCKWQAEGLVHIEGFPRLRERSLTDTAALSTF